MIGTGRGGRRIKPELAGTVAVIAGGGSGVGAAMGRRSAGVGMAIAALDIDEAAAKQTVAALAEEFGVSTTAVRVDDRCFRRGATAPETR